MCLEAYRKSPGSARIPIKRHEFDKKLSEWQFCYVNSKAKTHVSSLTLTLKHFIIKTKELM